MCSFELQFLLLIFKRQNTTENTVLKIPNNYPLTLTTKSEQEFSKLPKPFFGGGGEALKWWESIYNLSTEMYQFQIKELISSL